MYSISLKSLPFATSQEVFDQVAYHLLTQNLKASSGGICQYKFGKLKYAAGCLISEDEYKEEFEGNVWGILVDRKLVPRNHLELIKKL
jgi:hypothetical protein